MAQKKQQQDTEEDFTEDDFDEMAQSAAINEKKRQRELLR